VVVVVAALHTVRFRQGTSGKVQPALEQLLRCCMAGAAVTGVVAQRAEQVWRRMCMRWRRNTSSAWDQQTERSAAMLAVSHGHRR
jgi:hypothetical protein